MDDISALFGIFALVGGAIALPFAVAEEIAKFREMRVGKICKMYWDATAIACRAEPTGVKRYYHPFYGCGVPKKCCNLLRGHEGPHEMQDTKLVKKNMVSKK